MKFLLTLLSVLALLARTEAASASKHEVDTTDSSHRKLLWLDLDIAGRLVDLIGSIFNNGDDTDNEYLEDLQEESEVIATDAPTGSPTGTSSPTGNVDLAEASNATMLEELESTIDDMSNDTFIESMFDEGSSESDFAVSDIDPLEGKESILRESTMGGAAKGGGTRKARRGLRQGV